MRRLVLAVALALPVTLLTGCGNAKVVTPAPPETPLFKVSRAINQIQQSNKQFAQSVVQASTAGLISDNGARALLAVALKISQGGDQAAALVQGLTTLPPGTKVSVWTVMGPLVAVVNDSLATGLIPITNQNTKASVQAILTTIQAALAVVQVQVGGQ